MKRAINRPYTGDEFEFHLDFNNDLTKIQTPDGIVEYCRRNGLLDGAIVDVAAVIEQHPKLTLVYHDLGNNDAYIRRVDDHFEIGINANHPVTRQRFSMAHELAHFLLHRNSIDDLGQGEQILYRNDQRSPIECEANTFAANLLMPEETFFEVFDSANRNVMRMARTFRVSPDAVKYRAQNLGFATSV